MAGNPFIPKLNGVTSPYNFSSAKMSPSAQKPVLPSLAEAGEKYANTNAMMSAGANVIGTLGSAVAGSDYNPKVGMEKPNPFATFTNLQATSLGASVGGPVGAGIGFGVDMLKNTLAYKKQVSAYDQAVNKQELTDGIDSRLQSLQPDYTGMARYGMEANEAQEVTMEKEEIVLVPTKSGGYTKYMETDEDDPAHEQGGVKAQLPQGALVFPEKYKQKIEEALDNGDNETIEELAEQMKGESDAAAEANEPYSNNPAQSAKMLRYGGKIC